MGETANTFMPGSHGGHPDRRTHHAFNDALGTLIGTANVDVFGPSEVRRGPACHSASPAN
jgi:hypothetical protein